MHDSEQRRVLFLSTHFVTDRMLLHSGLLPRLSKTAEPVVWSFAPRDRHFASQTRFAHFYRDWPTMLDAIPEWLNILRRLTLFVWDHRGPSRTRRSFWKLKARQEALWDTRLAHVLAWPVAKLGLHGFIEKLVLRLMLRLGRNTYAAERLNELKPDLIIAMGPFQMVQMAVVAAAIKASIPVYAFITSWDNISTKNRLIFSYDGYIVWSEHMRQELFEFYPDERQKPTFLVGAPQFDVYVEPGYQVGRQEFCKSIGLDPSRPIILYALGTPNLIKEDYGALEFARRVYSNPETASWQIIVRPHPAFRQRGYDVLQSIPEQFSNVVIQEPHRHWVDIAFQGEDSTRELINTVLHSNVVINLASTVSVDAAVLDKPVVNVDFDPEPSQSRQELVKAIGREWNHFKPLFDSGGLWNVGDYESMIEAVQTYLRTPELHRDGRKWIVRHITGEADGNAGTRIADLCADLLGVQSAARVQGAASR